MKTLDGRKVDRKALEEIRIRAVLRVEAGESPEVVIKALGFTRGRIYEWLAKYREGGVEALKRTKARGKAPKLSGKQLQTIFHLVAGKDPRQLRFEFALWTRAMIRELIRREFGVHLSDVSVGRLLKKIGLSPQRPIRKAYQQDELLVVEWMAKDFPEIRKLAKEQEAEIFFGDESSVRSDYHSGTTLGPVGRTPVVRTTGKRFRVNLISAINPKGTMRFMIVEESFTSEVFCRFLKRLLVNAARPVFLIVDNHPVHRSKEVLDFAKKTKGKLRLFFLPPYSPELNPDEHVWNYLKNHKIGREGATNRWNLLKRVESVMRSLQNMPDKIKSFFRHAWTKYISMSGNQCTA